ncbi:terpene synthase family protein [Nocardia wallacei]|nr:hypothetical protein [Nocardia wallacei]
MTADARYTGRVEQVPPELEIPPLWCPIDPRIHPDVGVVGDRIGPWAAGLGFGQRSLLRGTASHAADWACRVAPDGQRDRLQWMADWTYWAFITDDQFTDSGPTMDKPHEWNPFICQMLAYGADPETRSETLDVNPFALGFRDLVTRLESLAPHRLPEWISDHYVWLLGSACSVSDRSAGRTRDLAEQLVIGPLDRAEALTTLFIEIVEGTQLPLSERRRPAVRAVTQAAQLLHCFYNDLASYRHELRQNSPESNFVHIIQTERRCHPQDAMVMAVRFLDRVMMLFVTLRDQLRHTGRPELCRYLDQLSHKIRGNSDYQIQVPRYTTTLDIDIDTPQGIQRATSPIYEYSDQPSDARLVPPAAAISWWWDQIDH